MVPIGNHSSSVTSESSEPLWWGCILGHSGLVATIVAKITMLSSQRLSRSSPSLSRSHRGDRLSEPFIWLWHAVSLGETNRATEYAFLKGSEWAGGLQMLNYCHGSPMHQHISNWAFWKPSIPSLLAKRVSYCSGGLRTLVIRRRGSRWMAPYGHRFHRRWSWSIQLVIIDQWRSFVEVST